MDRLRKILENESILYNQTGGGVIPTNYPNIVRRFYLEIKDDANLEKPETMEKAIKFKDNENLKYEHIEFVYYNLLKNFDIPDIFKIMK